MSLGVSVVICCYNSSMRLSKTLDHIAKQTSSEDVNIELIVVDNNSTDDTANLAKALWEILGNPFLCKIVKESIPGLAAAREKGVQESSFDYIIFCDDDNWLSPDYVNIAYTILHQHHTVGAVGGRSEAVFEEGVQKPDWFDKNEIYYAVGKQATESGDISFIKGYSWGAGIAFRKELFFKAVNEEFPSLLTDRKGNELSSGGDIEMCLRFILLGYQIYYDERLFFRHFISTSRVSLDYLNKIHVGNNKSEIILGKYYDFINLYFKDSKGKRQYQELKVIIKYLLNKLRLRKMSEIDLRLLKVYSNLVDDTDIRLIKNLYNSTNHSV